MGDYIDPASILEFKAATAKDSESLDGVKKLTIYHTPLSKDEVYKYWFERKEGDTWIMTSDRPRQQDRQGRLVSISGTTFGGSAIKAGHVFQHGYLEVYIEEGKNSGGVKHISIDRYEMEK